MINEIDLQSGNLEQMINEIDLQSGNLEMNQFIIAFFQNRFNKLFRRGETECAAKKLMKTERTAGRSCPGMDGMITL